MIVPGMTRLVGVVAAALQIWTLVLAGCRGLARVLFLDPAPPRRGVRRPRTAAPGVYVATLITRSFWRVTRFAAHVGEDSRLVWANVPTRVVAHAMPFLRATVHTATRAQRDARVIAGGAIQRKAARYAQDDWRP